MSEKFSDNQKRRILVIAQYFYPEQFRINDMCSEWAARGYDVTVITGIPNYPQGKYYTGYGIFKKRKEIYNGVKIKRLFLFPRGHNSIMLGLNYLSFVISGFVWKLFTPIKADAVFIFEVSPMTQALPGVWFAKRRKIPCYLYVQDLWPENLEIVAGIRNKKILEAVGKIVDYIYKRCTKIFTTSESFVKSIMARGVPSDRIEFWPQYAEDFYKPLKKSSIVEIPDDNCFNLIFAGNIGVAQGLEILPDVAEKLKYDNIRFNIVGDGRFKNELVKIVKTKQVDTLFNFIDKQPAERIPEFMAACDAALLCLTDNALFEMTIPAKLQSYLACGIPTIASAGGETEKIINDSKSGLCNPAGNVELLAVNILRMSLMSKEEIKQMGQNAHEYYKEFFNKKKLMDKMDKYFYAERDLPGTEITEGDNR